MDLYVASWSEYDVGNMHTASRSELQQAVRRAAKTANQRLRRLEKKGATKGVYRTAMKRLYGRKRFNERTDKLTLNQLRREYAILRDFILAKTSTLQGKRHADEKRYIKAVERGYTGDFDEFVTVIDSLFTEYRERFFSSSIIYDSMTTGTEDLIDKAIEKVKDKNIPENLVRGEALKEYLKMRAART